MTTCLKATIFEKRSSTICYITTKVHSFLKQCLHDLQFTKFDGMYFHQTFQLMSAEVSLIGLVKVPPNWVNWRWCKQCLKNEWTLTTRYLNGYGECLKILKKAIILWKGQESEEIRNVHHVFEVKRGWFNVHKLSWVLRLD